MGIWWIKFSDRGPACAALVSREEAKALGREAGEVVSMEVLPYPARPRLDDKEGWGEGQMPSFCYDPEHCKGRTSCPKSHSCVE